jgi:predicted AAA+ superfamily ATPase
MPVSEPIHEKIVEQLKNFLIIGGMPEVVAEFVKTHNFLNCQKILNSLLLAFRSDFAKYKKRIPAARINEVFSSVSQQAEGKFIYERVSQNLNNEQVKKSLELLVMAGLCYQVTHAAADGIPIGARINPRFRRIIPFDTGIYQRILNLDISGILLATDFETINKGAVAEIFVGCELKKNASCYSDEELYYWAREKKNANAQVDFVIQIGETIVPVEVKSGKQGKMQSMWMFLKEKNSNYGIRTSLENFCKYQNINVYPLYAISKFFICINYHPSALLSPFSFLPSPFLLSAFSFPLSSSPPAPQTPSNRLKKPSTSCRNRQKLLHAKVIFGSVKTLKLPLKISILASRRCCILSAFLRS